MMRDCSIVLLALLFCATAAFAQTPAKSKEAVKKAKSPTTEAAAAKTPDPPVAAKEGGSDLDRALNMWERMGKQTQTPAAQPTTAGQTAKPKEAPAKKTK